jgi:hypothetical protein
MSTTPYPPAPQFVDPRIVPQPPRLHWGWVLALSVLTRSLFGEIWLVVQANWVRRITGNSEPLTWAIVNVCVLPFVLFSAVALGIVIAIAGNHSIPQAIQSLFAGIAGLGTFVLYVIANFKMRSALEAAPIGIPLGGVMTFFFGPIYFQYFLHDYVLPDAAEMYGPLVSPPAYIPPPPPPASAA